MKSNILPISLAQVLAGAPKPDLTRVTGRNAAGGVLMEIQYGTKLYKAIVYGNTLVPLEALEVSEVEPITLNVSWSSDQEGGKTTH